MPPRPRGCLHRFRGFPLRGFPRELERIEGRRRGAAFARVLPLALAAMMPFPRPRDASAQAAATQPATAPAASAAPQSATRPVDSPPVLEGPRSITVGTSPRPLFAGPASYFGRIGEAVAGEVLAVLEQRRRWVRVRSRAAGDRGWTLGAEEVRGKPRDRRLLATLQSSSLGIGLVTKGFGEDRARRFTIESSALARWEAPRLDSAAYVRFVDEGGFPPQEGDVGLRRAGGDVPGEVEPPEDAPGAGVAPDAGETARVEETARALESARDRLAGRQAMAQSFLDLLDARAERELGRGMAAQVLAREGALYEDLGLEAYVTSVLAWVADHGARPEVPFVLGLLDDPTPRAISLPGGYVFVSVGLVRACENEAELAGVLAHEIAHVTLRHGLAQLDRARYRLQAKDALLEMDEVLAAGGEDDSPLRHRVRDDLERVATDIYGMIQAGRAKPLEFEADREAVQTLVLAGYDPLALAALLDRRARLEKASGSEASFLASHPPSRERAARIRATLLRLEVSPGGRLNEDRFRRETAGLRGEG